MNYKVLIIRLSSFGDIVQALPVSHALKDDARFSQVHWLVREDYKDLLSSHPYIDRIWEFQRRQGFYGLFTLFKELRTQNYTHIYDAHNNLRSNILLFLFRIYALLLFWQKHPRILQRAKNRLKRLLLFKMRINLLPKPFVGAQSFMDPLAHWGVKTSMPGPPNLFFAETPNLELPPAFISIVPSAAWPNKRWPLTHWKEFIKGFNQLPIVVLGGPQDDFCQELEDMAPERVLNLAGKTSLKESSYVISCSRLTISADTGLLHVADQLGVLNIGLIGPTAFGYTSQPQSKILEVELACKPCSKDGRDPCINKVLQKCMIDITPQMVIAQAKLMLESPHATHI